MMIMNQINRLQYLWFCCTTKPAGYTVRGEVGGKTLNVEQLACCLPCHGFPGGEVASRERHTEPNPMLGMT